MNDAPRQALKQILDRFGRDVCDDARRCEALLRDFAGEHRREIFVLISALEHGVAEDLRLLTGQLPFSVVLPRLTAELHETTALSEDAARWAVKAWAEALELVEEGALTDKGGATSTAAAAKSTTAWSGFRLVRRWTAHEREVGDLAFSPDGRQLASVGLDAVAYIWPLGSGSATSADEGDNGLQAGDRSRVATLRHQTGILTSIAWHPDGLTLALGSGDTGIYLWTWTEAGSETPRLRGHNGGVTGVCFLPGGTLLASCGQDGVVNLWDVEMETLQASLRGHTKGVLGLAVSADGRSLASAGGWDRTVRVWDVVQTQEMWVLSGHTAQVTSVAFGAGDKLLCSGAWDETVRLWDPKYGREAGQLTEEGDALHLISSIAVAPARAVRGHAPWVATGDWSGQVRVWDVHRKVLLGRLSEHAGQVRCVAFNSEGNWLASADDQGEICLWRAERSGAAP